MQKVILNKATALDLEIPGSIGQFSVKTDVGLSVPVKYIQTHIKFTTDETLQSRLFECLKPVREIFEPKHLEFEHLMQRDIDDARVSTSLIPYLLLPQTGDTVKFFPPIVCVVVPVSGDRRIQDRYPSIETAETQEPGADYKVVTQRSGALGNETFQFEQLKVGDQLQEYDYARLKINTSRCQIVIVDGQHRAMALLALYRNATKWPEKSAAYEHYYERWSPEIFKDHLNEISLPAVICTFPTLETSNALDGTDMSVVRACRSIFLALNKNARPVSAARNILLDDDDLIAHCERKLLGKIKDQDVNSEDALRLWNFELDAQDDKSKLRSTVAISGVMHIFSALERILLATDDPFGLNPPSIKKKQNADAFERSCLKRLNAFDLIGQELTDKTTRYSFTKEALAKLTESFQERYGNYMLKLFQKFYPFEACGSAAIELEKHIRGKHDDSCVKNLFEGQGNQYVFKSYIDSLSLELTQRYQDKKIPAELSKVLEYFHKTRERQEEYQEQYFESRIRTLMPKLSNKFSKAMFDSFNELYTRVFTTTAFQNALFITFFSTVEKLNKKRKNNSGIVDADASDDAIFDDYLNAMNSFFRPTNEKELRRLLSVFSGKVLGELSDGSLKVTPTFNNLKWVAFKGAELKPDEWGKYRYLLLEIWKLSKPADEDLKSQIDEYVARCREEVLNLYVVRKMQDFCKAQGLDTVPPPQLKEIKKEAVDVYLEALSELHGRMSKDDRKGLEKTIEHISQPSSEEGDGSEDSDE